MAHFSDNSKSIKWANRVIQRRGRVVMFLFGIFTFALLFFKLFSLQILQHEDLESKAIAQQTGSSVVTADRGDILDCNGNIVAISTSAKTIFLSPKEINDAILDKENPVAWTKETLASGLSDILGIEKETIYQKMENIESQYSVLMLKADDDIADRCKEFVSENNIVGVYFTDTTKRYYPYSNLASQVIGFVGDENTGLFGIEAAYEEELEGTAGLSVSAKDTAGHSLLYAYDQYFEEQNGGDITLTIDVNVQYYLEQGIQEMINSYYPSNGAAGIIMNAKTGAILAMASYPTFDLNDFLTVTDDALLLELEKEEIELGDAQLKQWRNKCVSDTYEPGSTFKIITLASCLEENIIDENTSFTCGGQIQVSGETIYCSNKNGHGVQTLKESVGNSCNPAFITYGLNLGKEKFYSYLQSFGLMETTGIDYGGEAVGVFAAKNSFSNLDLACYAFGQNFTVTPLSLISAQAACINGGYLHTPYLVEKITDDDGNITYQHETKTVRQVISEETSQTVRECLEYVVSEGTGKNGQVSGYRIGGKTGTADKGQTGDVVVSFLCFAPADDPEYIMLITMDTPSRATNVYVSGGNMVAPTSSKVFSNVLPYLGLEASYSANDLVGADATVPYCVGYTLDDAVALLEEQGFSYKVEGTGNEVTDQTPIGGSIVPGKSSIILYCGKDKPADLCTVPSLVGKTPSEASIAASNAGFLIRFSGATSSESSSIRVLSQVEEAGTQLEAGTVLNVQLGDRSVLD